MKLSVVDFSDGPLAMPPTRGHDLKLEYALGHGHLTGMPPTRGHDLKHIRTH